MAGARETVEKKILSAFDGSANVKTVEQAVRPREAFGTNSEDPAAMHAQVQFKPGGAQNRFDFTFDSYSKEPPPGATIGFELSAPPTPSTPKILSFFSGNVKNAFQGISKSFPWTSFWKKSPGSISIPAPA